MAAIVGGSKVSTKLDVLTALDNESQHTGAREYRLAPTMHELSIRVIDDSQARDPSLHAIAEIRDMTIFHKSQNANIDLISRINGKISAFVVRSLS